ncbi:MAG: benzoate-CoA ligase family protein [Acidobacteria bacterium]|nr:MAG: benzoate-CoA ligase family protein [Acidobacteriota bacterium]
MDDPADRFNLAEYLLDRNVAEGRGRKVALRCEQDSYTYSDLLSMANRTAGALQELGVRAEDRVLIVLPDGPEFVTSWCATLKLGAVFAMANIIHPPEDYLYYLNYTRAPVAVVHETVLGRIQAVLEGARSLRSVLVAGGTAGRSARSGEKRIVPFDDLLRGRSEALEPADTTTDDLAGWLFTSGSTGRPKGAVHTHGDFLYNTERYAMQVVGYQQSDITVSVPKLFFGYATGTNLIFPFAAGAATVLFPERSTPERMFEVIERHRPTVLTSVPTTINGMLSMRDAPGRDLSSLRVCLSAGEALPPELYRRWKQTYGVEILDGIGSAEMFHIYISNRFGEVRPGSLGKLVPGYEARIVRAGGEEVASGEQGTLWIRGGSTALCYWRDRAKSRETFRGDWCVTGDQFRRDAEGFFYYGGRTDEMLKVSGIFVSPLEIEDCLLSHPAVREVCVVGGEDEGGLTKPKAFVVLREGQDPTPQLVRNLQEHVKQRLSPYKYPRWVDFLPVLPRNDRGKVDRKRLREGRL